MSFKSDPATTHVIFDYNGTIIDLKNIFNKMVSFYGKKLNPDIVILKEKKIPEVDDVEEIIKIFYEAMYTRSSINYEEFAEEFKANVMKIGFELMPGFDKLVKHLFKNKIPMAIATNLKKKDFEMEMNFTKDLDFSQFSHYVCGWDDPEVKANKPSPEVYFICAKRFDPAPESLNSCVIFEDSLRGITGAVNTGMKTVLINNNSIVKSIEILNKITVIVDNFNIFKPESVGLPSY